jgi:hypothetical protein
MTTIVFPLAVAMVLGESALAKGRSLRAFALGLERYRLVSPRLSLFLASAVVAVAHSDFGRGG